jgi:acyl carrier protein
MMTTEEVKQTTQRVVLDLLPDVSHEELAEDSNIFSMGLDSINAMTLIFNLQDAFGIKFETNEINVENFCTVADIVKLIESKKEF